MSIKSKLENYLYDNEYKIIIKNNSINICNYTEIIDFDVNKIVIKNKDKKISIEGKNLIISKMLKEEVLITGIIKNISIN
ncbi:MAG: YabP/YqfC family sporulation protein [Bacilli bacterium]|nr:YabP/YqfC family sporulation protein [Bacilli bacterium]